MATADRDGAARPDADARPDAALDEAAARVARLFRHAGEHPAAQMLRELILRHRREQAARGADGAEHGHE